MILGEEVYSQKIIIPDKFVALAASEKEMKENIYPEFGETLKRFGISAFDFSGRRYE